MFSLAVSLLLAAAAPATAPIDTAAVKDSLLADVRSNVSICAVVNAARKTPCASRVLLEKLLPQLLPIEISRVGVRKQDAAELAKLAKDGRTEPPPPELRNLPEDMEVSLRIPSLAVTPGRDLEAMGVAGKIDVEIHTPKNPAIKVTKARLRFTGGLRATWAPDAAGCKKLDDGTSVVVYVALVVGQVEVETLSSERSWWAKLLPGDRTLRWLLNHSLGLAGLVLHGLDAYADLAKLGGRTPDHPLGFPLCLGRKATCKKPGAPRRPPASFLTAQVSIGKLGAIEFARAGSAKPFLELDSARFLCHAFEALTSLEQCRKPFFDSLFGAILPLPLSVPRELTSALTKDAAAAPPLSVILKAASVDVIDKPGPTAELHASVKASVVDPTNPANAPFDVAVAAEVKLGAVCDDKSMYFTKAMALESLSSSGAVPKWLSDGLGKAAVNAHLPAVDVCLGSPHIAAIDKSLDLCRLSQSLLETKSAGVAASAALEALLPLEVKPQRLLKPGAKPSLVKLFDGITVAVTGAKLATGKGPDSLSASIAIGKAGQADKLSAQATVAIGAQARCERGHGALRFTPRVTELSVARVPPWLLQTTLLQLVNDKLAKGPAVLCIHGACKGQPKLAVRAQPARPTLERETGCGADGRRP